MMRHVTDIQRRLIETGFLSPLNERGQSNLDGKFGERSLDAFNRFRASKGLGPVVQTSMAELNRLLFPEEQPVPPPKKPNFFEAAGVVVTLVNILKGKAMNWNDLQQVVRIVAYAAAGWLGAKGGLDPANVETLGGAIVALVSVGWWFFWNRKAAK